MCTYSPSIARMRSCRDINVIEALRQTVNFCEGVSGADWFIQRGAYKIITTTQHIRCPCDGLQEFAPFRCPPACTGAHDCGHCTTDASAADTDTDAALACAGACDFFLLLLLLREHLPLDKIELGTVAESGHGALERPDHVWVPGEAEYVFALVEVLLATYLLENLADIRVTGHAHADALRELVDGTDVNADDLTGASFGGAGHKQRL